MDHQHKASVADPIFGPSIFDGAVVNSCKVLDHRTYINHGLFHGPDGVAYRDPRGDTLYLTVGICITLSNGQTIYVEDKVAVPASAAAK